MSNQESEIRSQNKGQSVVALETFHASDHQPQIYRYYNIDGTLNVNCFILIFLLFVSICNSWY